MCLIQRTSSNARTSGPAHGGKPDTRAATYTTMVAILIILLKVAFSIWTIVLHHQNLDQMVRDMLSRGVVCGTSLESLASSLLMSIFIAGSALFDFVQMSVHEAKTSKNMPPVFQWTLSSHCVWEISSWRCSRYVGGGKLTKRRWRKRTFLFLVRVLHFETRTQTISGTRVFFRILISVLLLLPPVVIPEGHPMLHVLAAIVLLAILTGVVLYARQSMDTSDELWDFQRSRGESSCRTRFPLM